ncbi:MAG: PHP domain-containing protein [Candidatus Omnitrophota bacterium]
MDKKLCDLHIHSVFSDSDMELKEIFEAAKQKGLKCISITDHDTVDGLKEARQLSAHYGIELLDGVEISAQYGDVEVHILGYFTDSYGPGLINALEEIKVYRRQRLLTMARKLASLGVAVDSDELMARIKTAIPTRLHLALYLVEKSKAISISDAFRKYLSPRSPAYSARFKYSVEETIKLIKENGGLAFLAHPHMLKSQYALSEFVSWGLDGIEARYPHFTAQRTAFYEAKAEELGLLKSGGSDAHGSYKEFTEVGTVKVPYLWVEQIKIANSGALLNE